MCIQPKDVFWLKCDWNDTCSNFQFWFEMLYFIGLRKSWKRKEMQGIIFLFYDKKECVKEKRRKLNRHTK